MLRRATPLLVLGLLAASPVLRADPLTATDRQLLLEKLEALKKAAVGVQSTRITSAINVFHDAMGSDSEAINLYLKCIEKLNFEEQNKSGQDFRDWKRRQNDQLKEPALKLALRHQLQWLCLTLRAALAHGDYSKLAPDASAAVNALFAHATQLTGQGQLLRRSVLASVFARAYNVSFVDPGNWPTVPLDINGIYEKVILPPLRNPKSLDALRTAWQNRIRQEGLLAEWGQLPQSSGGHGKPIRNATHTTSYDKFIVETRPDLLWRMQVDLFRAGDQRDAALRMLDHLEKFQNHPKAPDWAQNFIDLISPPKKKPKPSKKP